MCVAWTTFTGYISLPDGHASPRQSLLLGVSNACTNLELCGARFHQPGFFGGFVG